MMNLKMMLNVALASLKAKGELTNLAFKVGGNRLSIGSIQYTKESSDSEVEIKFNVTPDDAGGADIQIKGTSADSISIKEFSITSEEGNSFSFDELTFTSAVEALEVLGQLVAPALTAAQKEIKFAKDLERRGPVN